MANKPLGHAMSAPFKSSPVEFNQHLLFPSNIFDLLQKIMNAFSMPTCFNSLIRVALKVFIALKARTPIIPSSSLQS